MKKIYLLIAILVLMSSLAWAQGQKGIPEAGQGTGQGQDGEAEGTGQETQTNTETQQQKKGEETQIQNQIQTQNRIKAGSYTIENGKQIQVQEQSNNRVQLKSGEVSAQTSMEMTQEQTQDKTKLKVKLSNGKNSEVKVMPDTASKKAMERLKMKVCSEENNCQIELKEVGQGEQARAAYEVKVKKQARFLGIFKTQMRVQAQVDAENGEVIQSKKPWWAFLASESEE